MPYMLRIRWFWENIPRASKPQQRPHFAEAQMVMGRIEKVQLQLFVELLTSASGAKKSSKMPV